MLLSILLVAGCEIDEPHVMAASLQRHEELLILLIGVFCFIQSVISIPKADLLFPYGAPFGDRNLDNDTDDYATLEIELTTPIVFYGQPYTSIHVSCVFFNNKSITLIIFFTCRLMKMGCSLFLRRLQSFSAFRSRWIIL